jgi:transcriptional regulator GlxA family with amidase domain
MNRLIEFEKCLAVSKLDFRVRLLLNHATSNLQSNLSLVRLAALSNICVGHVCRLFRAELRMSPGRCIKLLRLRSAAKLLATTSLSVKQVMATVGINDESHFVRDFEHVVGESPSRYRARHMKINCNC